MSAAAVEPVWPAEVVELDATTRGLVTLHLAVLEHYLVVEATSLIGAPDHAGMQAALVAKLLTGAGAPATRDAVLAAATVAPPRCLVCDRGVLRRADRLSGWCPPCGRFTGPADPRLRPNCSACGRPRRTSQDLCRGRCTGCEKITDSPVPVYAELLAHLLGDAA